MKELWTPQPDSRARRPQRLSDVIDVVAPLVTTEQSPPGEPSTVATVKIPVLYPKCTSDVETKGEVHSQKQHH